MARDPHGLLIRKWAETAPANLVTVPDEQMGVSRSAGLPASFGVDRYFALAAINGMWRELCGFDVDVATHGLLEWSASQEPGYAHPSLVFGSDGLIYRSVQAGGQVQDPTTDASFVYWRPVLPAEFLAFATATQVEAGSSATLIVTPQRLLQGLFKSNPNSRWRADTANFGLVKRASASEVSGRSGDGYVRAGDLPAAPRAYVPTNSSTTARGIIRTATQAEGRAGTASAPAMTPALVLDALRNGADYAATTSRKGAVELATTTEAENGTDTTKAVTPAGLEARIDNIPSATAPPDATTAKRGLVELATPAEAEAGTDTERAVTPAGLKAAIDEIDIPSVDLPNSTTTKRGIIRTATQDEGRGGSASSPAMTPALVLDALRNGADYAATTSRKGAVELATTTEAENGTDTTKAVTPAGLEARIDNIPSATAPPDATTAKRGLVELATPAEAEAGTDTERAVTPAGLKAAIDEIDIPSVDLPNSTTTKRGIIRTATQDEGRGGSASSPAMTPALVLDALRNGADYAATTSRKGAVELATTTEAENGTDTTKAVTPAGLEARIDNIPSATAPPDATTAKRGLVELATPAEAEAGTDTERAVTPAGLKAAIDEIDIPSVDLPNSTTTKRGIIRTATQDEGRGGSASSPAMTPALVLDALRNGADYAATTSRKGAVELATAAEVRTGTDTGRAATPAGVKSAIDAVSGGITGERNGKSANYTVVAGDNGKIIEVSASGRARTVTLPDLASTDNGFTVTIIKTDSSSNTVTIDGDSTDTVNGAATYVLRRRWEAAILKWTGSAWLAIGQSNREDTSKANTSDIPSGPPNATTSRRGIVELATNAETVAGTDSERAVTPASLANFFGSASSHEVTAAGTTTFTWPWNTPKGLAIIEGGGGGGGGGSVRRGNFLYAAGRGGDHNSPGSRPNPDNTLGGSGGDGGEDTTLEVGGATYRAEGGGGGSGGLVGQQPNRPRLGGDGGGKTLDSNDIVGGGNSTIGIGGAGGEGRNSSDERDMARDGFRAGDGQLVVVRLTGLSRGDRLTLNVGDGGAGGAGGAAGSIGAATSGAKGHAGKITLIPLF